MRTQIPINIVSEGLDFQLHPWQQTIIFLDAGNLLPRDVGHEQGHSPIRKEGGQQVDPNT